jgi:serine/threonine protein kinase/HD-like signal output (HDOD) protein
MAEGLGTENGTRNASGSAKDDGMIGQAVGSYVITATLGEGGMGKVYLANHTLIGRKAAIKILNPAIAADGEAVSRFFTEARLVNDIRHPNIVEITDFGQFSSLYCIVMELLEGETLAARLHRVRTLDEATAVRIFRQVSSALGAAHDQGMVHRDVKPENIFLRHHPDYPDFVKVLDFGIAKLLGNNSPVGHHTKTGTVIGTPAYMSPEQCLGESSLDLRSDIYSLGVVLYEALTGRQPFVGDTLGRLIVCHVSETPIAPSALNPAVSAAMSEVVMRALAKRPADRFASMKELREALEIAPVRAPAVNVVSGRQRSITRPVPHDPRAAAQPAAPASAARLSATASAAPSVAADPVDTAQEQAVKLVNLVLDRFATGRIDLPAVNDVTGHCLDLMRRVNLGFTEVARAIGQSPILKSRVMRLANSAAFPSLMPATTIDMAVARLGIEGLHDALVEFAARDVLEGRQHARVKDALRRIWPQSVGAGLIAGNLCDLSGREGEQTSAYLAGLLHNIGKPLVGGLLTEIEQQMIRAGDRQPIGEAVWTATIEASHRQFGAALIRKWKLAPAIAEAIESSATFDTARPRSLSNVVRFSVALAQRLGLTIGPSNPTHAEEACAQGRALLQIDDRNMRLLSHGLKERALVLSGIRGQ